MESVILVIHLFLALAIIALVLLQRSEGGGLGIGGGGLGGLATAQGAANLLTRLTAIFAGLFFLTSLILGILAGTHTQTAKPLSEALQNVPAQNESPAVPGADDGAAKQLPSVPISDQ
jgi:preprotein translocase subunit SecG